MLFRSQGQGKGNQKEGKGDGDNEGRFDQHIEGNERLGEKERRELEKQWADRTREALVVSKMKGDTPAGINRLIGKLHEEKINWKALLNQFIIKQIPYDFTYGSCHKKSISVGTYMPNVLKEKIDINIMVDLSGSVGQKEYADFMSEIIGIARAFQDRIDMGVYSHDTEIYDNGLVRNGNIEKLKEMELKGGGGTSFERPLEYFKKNNINPKCLIWLTDGYGDSFDKTNFPILWILTEGGTDRYIKDKGQVIKLEDF